MSDEGRARTGGDTPSDPPAKEPTGLPNAKSAARRRDDETEPQTPTQKKGKSKKKSTSLRPGAPDAPHTDRAEHEPKPSGLKALTTSARQRLQLVLEDSIPPPADPKAPPALANLGRLPFDRRELKVVRSLSRWIGFCGLMMLAVGALTGLSYLTGEGKVAHVVVGILSTAVSIWLLAAALAFYRVAVTKGRQQHHLVNGLGLLRSALLLKAILLFSGMVLGCVTFSLAASLLFLL